MRAASVAAPLLAIRSTMLLACEMTNVLFIMNKACGATVVTSRAPLTASPYCTVPPVAVTFNIALRLRSGDLILMNAGLAKLIPC